MRAMKVLRDYSEPGITYSEVGRRNPHTVVRNGKSVLVPMSRQRVQKIVEFWKKRNNPGFRPRGYREGDIIAWGGRTYRVLRYDNTQQGAVRDLLDGTVYDPFLWVRGGARSRRIAGSGPAQPGR